MVVMIKSFRTRTFLTIAILFVFILLIYNIHISIVSAKPVANNATSCLSNPSPLEDISLTNEQQLIGHSHEEHVYLRNMTNMIVTWHKSITNDVPTVPCLSSDSHLLVLSAAASRVRFGTSVTFILVHPSDVKRTLPKNILSKPLSPNDVSLWCVFDDGSVTPAYGYDSRYGNDRVSLLDCSLNSFARHQLWTLNSTLRVHLVSSTNRNRTMPILRAFINTPKPMPNPSNSSGVLLTMCSSPLHNTAKHLIQWIEFHRLVGFRKFVIYNTTDTNAHLSSILKLYNRKHPNFVDVVQWNFSSLALTDVMSDRYFQVEAAHDCMIRYGDQSDWLGMLDLDEYIVPLHPYDTLLQYLHDNYGHRVVGSIILWSQFFCTQEIDRYTAEENDTSRLIIERFTLHGPQLYKQGREKYLYRPRFVQYLSIHHHIVGLSREEPSAAHINLAHYTSMDRLRAMPGCRSDQYVIDTGIRDRFAMKVKNAIKALLTSE